MIRGVSIEAQTALRTRPRVGDAISDFESYLIGEMLRTATKTVSGDDLLGGGHAGRMYREFFYAEIGNLAARGGGFGLAASLASGRSPEARGDAK